MPSQNVPNPESYEQILGDALSSYAAKVGIDDFNVGSAVTSFFEVAALMTARASGDIFQILRDFSVDRATGDALQRLAIENGITPITAQPATGFVTVTDLSFVKISTKVYAGTPPPNIGSITINVGDASEFPASGALYIGRGTPNVEGPIPYIVAPVNVGNYWTITLNTATVKFHNLGESVILAQGGNRSIPVNTIVISPAIGANPDIQYAVNSAAIILDGETTVTNVPVSAQLPGAAGNVPIGAIKLFATNPPGLPDASVTNPLSFTTGSDNESDDQLRVRIKAKLSSIGLGTAFAVESGVIGAQSSDQQATIVSDDIQLTTDGAILYIDDGTGYEATTAGVGIESIVDSAIGGELFFQLATGGRQAPVAKAFLITTLSAPFDLIGGDSLAIVVGGHTYQHNFVTSDFRSPGSATAFEITTSINGDTALGFEAVTSGGGSFVVVRGKAEGHDSIQTTTPVTTGRDAAIQMGFPFSQSQTLRLYKNQIPLSEDGNTATVFTTQQQLWSVGIQNGDTLILSVDGTAPITYTINDSDFVATGLYTSVSATNSLESWVQVFNNKLTGVTTEAVGQTLSITSNLLENNRAQVVIDPGSTLVTKGMFATSVGLSSQGSASDYVLDRNTAQFELAVPLVAGDNLAAGTIQTEARIQSNVISGGSITFTSNAYIWVLIDDPGQIIQTGIIATSLLGVAKPATNIIRYTTNVLNAFNNVHIGDYLIAWTQDLPPTDRFEGRVHAVTNTTLDILVTPAEYAAAIIVPGVLFTQGFIVLRSSEAPQKFEITTGTYTLDQAAVALQAQSQSIVFSVQQEERLVMRSRTKDTTGSLLIVTADPQGQFLNFVAGATDKSKTSLIAFYDSQEYDAQMPLFIHSSFSTGTSAQPPDSFIQSFLSNTSLTGRNPNELIALLQPYGVPAVLTTTGNTTSLSNQLTSLASTAGLSFGFFIVGLGIPLGTTVIAITGSTVTMSNNATATASGVSVTFNSLPQDAQPYGEYVQESYPIPSGSTVNISYPNLITNSNLNVSRDIRRLRGSDGGIPDRYFIANPLDFGPKDTLLVVVDNNPVDETFEIPLFRQATTNTTFASNPSSFNAYDSSAGPTTSFTSTFGAMFDFSNFKVLMQAKRVLKPTPSQTALLYRSAPFGDGGEFTNVGYVYPSIPNASIGSTVIVDENTTILISLKSGAAVSSAIDASTEWNISITPNTPIAGIDQVTYAWNGIGIAPALTLSGGEYVNITTGTEFNKANDGVFRVSTQGGFTPTATQFTVQRPTGVAIAENNKATQVNGAITFYASSPTTAAQINAYVNTNLSQYFTTTIVNDGGMTGSGVIVLSTYEDSGFTFRTVFLLDGVNWIAVSNLGGSPQFIFKVPLVYPAAGPGNIWYAFNNGETIILSPTTMDQVHRFISVLAVTGFTTEGTVGVVDRGTRIELATDTLGSSGSIQILGGLGNEYEVPVLDSAVRVDNSIMNISVNRVSGQGIQSDQWFRLQASNEQPKETLVSSNTSVTIIPDSPITGQSTVRLLNRTLTQRYFGKPRNHVRTQGRTFKVEKQGSLVCLSWNGVGSNPIFQKSPLNLNDTGGGTVNIAPAMQVDEFKIIVLTGNANFTELSIGDLLTVSGMATGNNGTFLVTGVSDDGRTVQLLNPSGSSQFSSGTYTLNTNLSDGDTFTIGSTTLTARTVPTLTTEFLIGGTAAQTAANLSAKIGTLAGVTSSVSSNVVTVTATTPSASIAFTKVSTHVTISPVGGFLVGSTFVAGNFSASSQVTEGDTVVMGPPFNILNQGKFRVIRRGKTSDGDGNSIWFENSNVVEEEVNLPYNPISLGFDATTSFNINASNHSILLTWNGVGTQPTLGNAQMGDVVTFGTDFAAANQGSFMVLRSGTTFLEAINPSAVTQATVFVTGGILQDHRPQIQFSEYEATVQGDKVVLTNNIFLVPNVGSWTVVRALDRDNAIIVGTRSAITNVSLNGIESSLFVQEGVAYSGYKHAIFTAAQPGAPTRTLVTFDTNDQVDKINQSGAVQLVALNKMDYSTIIKIGLDSYRYNTGLIAEANRIIYGDPRDPITYPGIGAAGADIFVREPLARRIQVSLAIRLNTGVPFAQTADQVRNSVSSLINSNPLGQSISISSIVSVVQAIPGIISVAVSFPQYDVADDLIKLTTGEKAFIVDPTIDISVAQIGT